MSATVAVTRSEVIGRQRVRTFTYTGDSSYPRGGEAFLPGAVALSSIESISALTPSNGVQAAYDAVNGKMKVLARSSPVGVTRNVKYAAGAAAAGVVVYAHVPTATVDVARETGENLPVLGWLEFISPTTTNGSFLLSNGDSVTVYHDAAANTGGIQVYDDEDEAVVSPLQANIATLLRDVIVRTQAGNYILISHDASAASNGVAVYFDEDAADASKVLFVSPTTTDSLVTVDPEVTPTAQDAGLTFNLMARGV